LDYHSSADEPRSKCELRQVPVRTAKASRDKLGLALLGAGNFAQSMLLPHLARHPNIRLRAVVTQSGLTARSVAERFGFEVCVSEPETVLADSEVGVVVVASRHDSHASLVCEALRAGKPVFVEKPLAITKEQLAEVEVVYHASSAPFVCVGFNRRFAPATAVLREFLSDLNEPALMNYRVNAGYVPREHWTQDPEQGGGRIVGEVCHFIDLLMYLTGAAPIEVYAQALPDHDRYSRDNITISIRFANHSVGTVIYAANGDRAMPKERLEIFCAGRTAILEDYRSVLLLKHGKKTAQNFAPDKGHKNEMDALVNAVQNGCHSPIPFSDALIGTNATLAVIDSLTLGWPIVLDSFATTND